MVSFGSYLTKKDGLIYDFLADGDIQQFSIHNYRPSLLPIELSKMKRILAKPWNNPSGVTKAHRLVHITDLEPGITWSKLSRYFIPYKIEYHHLFGTEALIQFKEPADAAKFLQEKNFYISELRSTVTFSQLPQLIIPPPANKVPSRSCVICIQIIKIRSYLGIQDIYEECSMFGKVMKIICFDKSGKYALVQMETVEQAALALSNINASPRYLPTFQMRVQYSKNQDIVIKFNNSKSFDFSVPGAQDQFEAVRDGLTGEVPFFEPDKNPSIPKTFDYFKPVLFDQNLGNVLSVSGLDEAHANTHFVRNLFIQYGVILKVKVLIKSPKKTAFVQMRNGFFARFAMTNLQNLPLAESNLQIDISSHPDVHPQSVDNLDENAFMEYSPDADDPDIEDYGKMWCACEYITVRPSNIKITELGLPLEEAKVDESQNVARFPSVSAAAAFIGTHSQMQVGKRSITLAFTKPISSL